jgi:hypothetical protein
MANDHNAFMREFWMRAISHDPNNVETLRELLQDHSEHVIHSGVAMTNLWVNMQQQMTSVK